MVEYQNGNGPTMRALKLLPPSQSANVGLFGTAARRTAERHNLESHI